MNESFFCQLEFIENLCNNFIYKSSEENLFYKLSLSKYIDGWIVKDTSQGLRKM